MNMTESPLNIEGRSVKLKTLLKPKPKRPKPKPIMSMRDNRGWLVRLGKVDVAVGFPGVLLRFQGFGDSARDDSFVATKGGT